MTIVKHIEQELSAFYPQGELRALIRLLLYHVAGWEQTDMLLHPDRELSAEQICYIDDAIERLKLHEPIQYILGETEFCGCRIKVDKNVLIPRPETAELVELIGQKMPENPTILDIGTGSGCIAVALAKNNSDARVSAWDVSVEALKVARENATENGVKVCFEQHDILQPQVCGQKWDVVVSNPPYIERSEQSEMEANVLEYEPHLALFVDDVDPLLFYRKIVGFCGENLKSGGWLFFEINRRFGNEICELLRQNGFTHVELRKDIFGNDRMAFGKLGVRSCKLRIMNLEL